MADNDCILNDIRNKLLSHFKEHNEYDFMFRVREDAIRIIDEFNNKNDKIYIKVHFNFQSTASIITTTSTTSATSAISAGGDIGESGVERYMRLAGLNSYESEIENYMLMQELNVIPKLYQHGYLSSHKIKFNYQSENIILKIYYIILEKCGQSLYDKYIKPLEHKLEGDYLGPGTESELLLSDSQTEYERFPSIIPQEIRTQIINIVSLLYKNNLSLKDIHTGNFVEKDGLVKVIDLEYCWVIQHNPDLLK